MQCRSAQRNERRRSRERGRQRGGSDTDRHTETGWEREPEREREREREILRESKREVEMETERERVCVCMRENESKAGIMYATLHVSKHPPWAGARTGLPAWHEDDAAEASSSSQLAREVVPAPRMLPHFLHLQSRPSHFPPHCTHQAQEEPLVSAAAVDRPNRQLLERGVWGFSTQRDFVSLPVLPSSKIAKDDL